MSALCSIPGCSKPSKARSLCQMHYCRVLRTGTSAPRPKAPPFRDEGGYLVVTGSDHPLAVKGRRVRLHRAAYYDAVEGTCPERCAWCWRPFASWREVDVDHVDHDKTNNDPSNLVASCRSCNTWRHPSRDANAWIERTALRRLAVLHPAEFEVQSENVARLLDTGLRCDGKAA